MIIKWVDIKKVDHDNCDYCKSFIFGKAKQVSIEFKGFGRGDDEVYFLCKKCLKQLPGENHIEYGLRIMTAFTEAEDIQEALNNERDFRPDFNSES